MTTYRKKGYIAVGSVDGNGKLPCEPVTKSGDDGLHGERSGNDDGGTEDAACWQEGGECVGDEIGAGEEGWVKRRSELIFPFLSRELVK